jgi:hypothetical protein
MKLNIIIIAILGFSIFFVTGQAYAPCIEGPGINCNNYPPPSLSQIKFDKLNYETSDKPIVTIIGAPDAVAHLEIDDSSSNIIFTHDTNMSPNGTVSYVVDISSYKPGVYSVIVTSLISKLTTSFAVGLAPTGGPIMLNTDRNSYHPGDNVTIVGAWNPNTLIQLSLIDPNGISVKSIQIFSDKTGHFFSLDFAIPSVAVTGTWKLDSTSGVSHSSVNITVENVTGTQIDKTITLSPLKQFKSGIAANDVTCRYGLQLIFKFEDSSPVCVTKQTAQTLVERWWGIYVPAVTEQNIPILSNSIKVQNTDFIINYNISGSNKLVDANMDSQSKSLILSLNTINNGTLVVSIPRALLDIKKNDRGMGEFHMLADGQETTFKEIHTTLTDRIFSIPFQNGTKNIEIIASELI